MRLSLHKERPQYAGLDHDRFMGLDEETWRAVDLFPYLPVVELEEISVVGPLPQPGDTRDNGLHGFRLDLLFPAPLEQLLPVQADIVVRLLPSCSAGRIRMTPLHFTIEAREAHRRIGLPGAGLQRIH